jgi:hypothetical protein
MTIEFGLTDGLVNTQYAPLAALSARYQRNLTLKPLKEVEVPVKKRDFNPSDKLIQVLLSILAGCETHIGLPIRQWMNPPATAGKSAVNRAPSLVYQALPCFSPELQLGAATGGVALFSTFYPKKFRQRALAAAGASR